MKFYAIVGPLWTVSRGASIFDVSSGELRDDVPPCSKSDVSVSARSDAVKVPSGLKMSMCEKLASSLLSPVSTSVH